MHVESRLSTFGLTAASCGSVSCPIVWNPFSVRADAMSSFYGMLSFWRTSPTLLPLDSELNLPRTYKMLHSISKPAESCVISQLSGSHRVFELLLTHFPDDLIFLDQKLRSSPALRFRSVVAIRVCEHPFDLLFKKYPFPCFSPEMSCDQLRTFFHRERGSVGFDDLLWLTSQISAERLKRLCSSACV